MLTPESLLEEAKVRGLPLIKKRAILREYLHLLMLKAIYQVPSGEKLFFTGGTALRLFYELPRFSEDLDFDAMEFPKESMEEILGQIHSSLENEGFRSEGGFKEGSSILRAFVKFTDALQQYGLTPLRGEKLQVKIEVYIPSWKLKGKTEILQGFGLAFPCRRLDESELLAEKLLALFNRKRGRDIYDLFFMVRRNFPFDSGILHSRGLKEPIHEKLQAFFEGLKEGELKSLRRQIAPFLFREDEGEWIEQAPKYFEAFMKKRG